MSQSDISSVTPCTPLQEGIISRSRHGEPGLYFSSFHLKLVTAVNLDIIVDELKDAWIRLYQHIPILRAVFVLTDEGYAQVVLVPEAAPFPWHEMNNPSEDDIAEQKQDWVESNYSNELTLLQPFKLCMVRSTEECQIIVHLFHALYDANSLNMLLDLLYRCCKEDQSGIPSALTFTDALPYGPLQPAVGAEAFWKQHLHSRVPPRPLSFGAPGGAQRHVHVSVRLNTDQRLEAVRRRLHVTHQAIIQASWMALLRRYTIGPITVGIVVSGRNLAVDGVEEVIGPMFNTLPFQLEVNHGETWENVIRQCHDFNVSAIPFQHTPLRQIHKWMQVSRQPPLFDSLFVFQKRTKMTKSAMSNDLWSLTIADTLLDYPLALEIEYDEDGELELTLAAQGNFMDKTIAHSILNQLRTIILTMVVSPSFISTTVDTRRIQNPETNGVNNASSTSLSPPTTGTSTTPGSAPSYEWTFNASLIRSEIARLAAVEESIVRPATSIFELGLDSIDAVKLVGKLRNAGMKIAVSTIMKRPVVSDIIGNASVNPRRRPPLLDLDAIEARLRKLVSFELSNVERVLPCTPLQEGMLFKMVESNYQQYYNHDVLKIAPEIRIERLKQAFEEVYTREPILRTAFVLANDSEFTFAQAIGSPGGLPWTELEVGSEDDLPKVLKFITTDAAQAPTGSAKFRLTLVRLPSSRLLVLSLPHAMYDGWSLRLLHQAVHQCYELPSIVIDASMNLIVATLADIVRADNPQAAEFWEDYLAKAKPCLLSAGKDSTLVAGSATHLKECKSILTLDRIHEFCRNQRVTLQALGQLCWTIVLASRTGDLEVIFGVVLACRDTLDSHNIIFPTMNTIAFRSLIHGTRGDMLRYTQDSMSSIREFQQFPLRKAQRFANVQQGKLFDSVFIYQKNPEIAASSDKNLYQSIKSESSVEYAVCVEMEEVGDDFIWRVACQDRIFTEDETDQLLSHLNDVLVDILGDSNAESFEINGDELRLGSLPLCLRKSQAKPSHSSDQQAHDISGLSELSLAESTILSVLSEVSKIPETFISREQNFFQLGLDSISVLKVSALLRQRSVHLSISQILQASTIHQMAQLAESQAEHQEFVSDDEPLAELDLDRLARVLRIDKTRIEEALPATAGQTYTLTSWRVSEGALFYPTFDFEVAGPITAEAIEASWAKVVDYNPILRTIFVMMDDPSTSVVQIVLRSGSDSVVEQPFAKLVIRPMQNNRWTLQLRIHHALYDARSLRQLMRQLEYFLQGHSEVLGVNKSFSTLVRQAYTPGAIFRAKSFWIKYLDGMHTAHKLSVSTSAPSADIRHYRPDILDAPSRYLQQMAPYYGVGVPQLFMAAWAKLYDGLTVKSQTNGIANSDVIIGVYLANRPFATQWIDGLDEVAAPTLNLVPLRVRSPSTKDIIEIAKQIQSDLIEIGSLENAMTNLWSIREWTGVTVDNFVNFLPRSHDSTDNSVVNVNTIRVTEVDEHDVPVSEACWRAEANCRESVLQSGGPLQTLFNELGRSGIVEAYPVSLPLYAFL